MFKQLKQLFKDFTYFIQDWGDIRILIKDLHDRAINPDFQGHTKELIRDILGSWKLSDLKNKELPQEEMKVRDATLAGIYKEYLESELNNLMKQQIEFSVMNSENWNQVLFNRGTINGFDLLKSKLEEAYNRHLENVKPEEKFDKHEIF